MDYNLQGLSSRSFEQLVQAIAAKVIGPQLIVFGDGPNGGREATFEGRIPYPSPDAPWTGYGILQASKADGNWALQQLHSELKTFSIAPQARKMVARGERAARSPWFVWGRRRALQER